MAEEKIQLERVAEIARLKLSDEEREKFGRDLESILSQFAEINAITGIEKVREIYYVNGEKNSLREDAVSPCANSDEIFGLFTRKEGKFMVAPKSLE